jgi:localization factor PodJL
MTAGAPWSVKGIDPKAREIAKDLARRSGMTLGEWLNQVILEDEAPVEDAPRYPTFGRQASPPPRRYETFSRPVEEAFRVSDAMDRLSARIEAAEGRSANAIGGIEEAVAQLVGRLGETEREQHAIGAHLEGAFEAIRAEQSKAAAQLERIERDANDTSVGEALKSLEGTLAKVATQVIEGQDETREVFNGLRQELDGVHERLEAAFSEDAARDLLEAAVTRLTGRLEQAEARTSEALSGLKTSFAGLDGRLKAAETKLQDRSQSDRLESLAASLTEQIGAVRTEMVENMRASANDGRFSRVDDALNALGDHVQAAEQRSAGAIEKMGHEVLRMADTLARQMQEGEQRSGDALKAAEQRLHAAMDAVAPLSEDAILAKAAEHADQAANAVASRYDGAIAAAEERSLQALARSNEEIGGEMARVAETLARGIEDAEQRSARGIEKVGGEISRVADAMEARLNQADAIGAKTLERLGAEIASITERLTERIAGAERRSAQAIDDIGDQVARVSDRIADRQERAATDLSERIRLSEERTAKILDEARERIDQRLADTRGRMAAEAAPAREPLAYEAYADPAVAPFGDHSFAEPAAAPAVYDDHALATPEHDIEEPAVFGAHYEPEDLEPEHRASLAERAFEHTLNMEAPAEVEDLEPVAAAHEAEPEHAQDLDEADALAALHARLFAQTASDELEVEPEHEPVAAADPFADDDALIEPLHAEGATPDFGAGLFSASETAHAEIDPDEDWLSPIPAEDERESEVEGELHSFTPHTEDHADDDFALHGFEPESREAETEESPFGLAALARHDEDAGHAEPDHVEPEANGGFEADDDFLPAAPARPKTARELVEQARAAAKASSAAQDSKSRGEGGGGMFGGLLGGKKDKKKRGSTMRTALLVSGGTAAMGVALAGYVILSSQPQGPLPARVASALGAHGAQTSAPAPANPIAAVALSPQPIAGQIAGANNPAAAVTPPANGGAELYNDAVRRIEAKDRTGVASLQKAANLGYAPAQFYLAKLYEDGQAGLTKDLTEARRWTERAAEGGDRKAMHNLALYNFEGVGGPKNLTTAAQWFRRAADLGLVDSQYNLARLYEEGFGVAQNPAEAYKWYLIAGRQGDGESRLSALRIKAQLSAEAQSAAERAAQGYQPQAGAMAAAAPASTPASDTASTALAQRALTKLGFYQGPTDGSASPALKLAIAAYQRGQGLLATGQLDPTVTQKLGAVLQQ